MRRHLRKIFLILIVVAALVVLVFHSRNRIHLADFTWIKFKAAVEQANIWLLLLSVLAIYGCYTIRAARWQRLCKYIGPSRFRDIVSATIMGFAAIFILGRPGEVVRPFLISRKSRLPVASMFGILLLERLFDFAAAVALATLSLLVFSRQLSEDGANTDWVDQARTGGYLLLAILLAVILLLAYFRLHGAGALDRRLKNWHDVGGWRGWIATVTDGFSQGLQAIRSVGDLWSVVFYTAIHWAAVAVVYLWICKSFEGAFPHSVVNFPGAMLLLAVTLVGATLQLPGVGGGAQVASFIALTTIFQVDQEPAAAMAVVLWLVTFAAPAFLGIPMLIHEGFSMADLRQLARKEVNAEKSGGHVLPDNHELHDSSSGSGRGGAR